MIYITMLILSAALIFALIHKLLFTSVFIGFLSAVFLKFLKDEEFRKFISKYI